MRSLSEIAAALDTDKGPQGLNGQGVFPGHNYTATYELLFTFLREEPITLLELGVWAGGSMRLWAETFSRATIHGLDTDMSRIDLASLPPNVRLWQGNQTDPNILAEITAVAGGFDVIVDDASHVEADQTASLWMLWPTIRHGGYYIIEDVQSGIPPAAWQAVTECAPEVIRSAMSPTVCAAVYRKWDT